MPLRTAKLVGSAYSDTGPVNLTVTWNRIEVWAGAVRTRPTAEKLADTFTPRDHLCEWTFPIDVHGSVPVRIDVVNGELAWQAVWCNYGFVNQRIELKPQSNWPIGAPESTEEALADWSILTPGEWVAKYGAESLDNFENKMISPAAENFCSAWLHDNAPDVDSDGKNNVRINGVSFGIDVAMRSQGLMGDWVWRLQSGQTIEADITVDPPQFDDGET